MSTFDAKKLYTIGRALILVGVAAAALAPFYVRYRAASAASEFESKHREFFERHMPVLIGSSPTTNGKDYVAFSGRTMAHISESFVIQLDDGRVIASDGGQISHLSTGYRDDIERVPRFLWILAICMTVFGALIVVGGRSLSARQDTSRKVASADE